MEERLKLIFDNMMKKTPNEINQNDNEILNIYNSYDVLLPLFSLLNNKNNTSDIRTFAICGIKRTIINIGSNLDDSSISQLKNELIHSLLNISELEIARLLIDSFLPILPKWPELIDTINNILRINDILNNQSLIQNIMLVSSKIIQEEWFTMEKNSFLEGCFFMISKSLENETNIEVSLELFASILKIIYNSNQNSMDIVNEIPMFKAFFLQYLEFYKFFLINDTIKTSNIQNLLINCINFINNQCFLQSCANFLIGLIQLDDISCKNKVSILNVITSIIKKEPFINLFEFLLQSSLLCSSILFDEFCYLENGSMLVSFKFCSHYRSIFNNNEFFNFIINNIKSDSANSIFSSLVLINQVLEYFKENKYMKNKLLEFVLQCCRAPVHSIVELAFSIIDNYTYLISKTVIPFILDAALEILPVSVCHKEIAGIILDALSSLIFNKKIEDFYFEKILLLLFNLIQNENIIFVIDKLFLCFAGIVQKFYISKDANIKNQTLTAISNILIESIKSFNPQCPLSQAAAVESLSVCITNYPSLYEDLIPNYLNLLVNWISDISNRVNFYSGIYCINELFSKLSFNKIPEKMMSTICSNLSKYIVINELQDENYFDIYESGISIKSIQKICFSFIENIYQKCQINDENFRILINSLLQSVLSNPVSQKSEINTLISICSSNNPKSQYLIEKSIDFFINNFKTIPNQSVFFFLKLFKNVHFEKIIKKEIDYNKILIVLENCLTMLQNSEFSCLKVLVYFSKYLKGFPIGIFFHIFKSIISNITPNEIAIIIKIFCNYIESNGINQELYEIYNDMMEFSFSCIKYCVNLLIKPTPIRFLTIVISQQQISINNDILSQFYDSFLCILNSDQTENKFYDQTINEVLLLIFKIIIVFPNIQFPYFSFMPKIFQLFPRKTYFENNSEILHYITELPKTSIYGNLAKYSYDIFSCLLRVTSLSEADIYKLGIDDQTMLKTAHFTFQMKKCFENSDALVNTILNNDTEKLAILQKRISKALSNSNVFQSNRTI